jgi:group I intron endonuclease
MKPKFPAIYSITFSNIDRIYIGSTTNYKLRKSQHLYKLKTNTHENSKLQNYYNKYGVENFEFKVIELLEETDLLKIREIEQSYLNKYFAQEYIISNRLDKRFDELTLNISPEVSMEIHYWTEERRERQRLRNKSRVWTEYSKQKMKNSKRGIKRSLEAKQKTSLSLKNFYKEIKNKENIDCPHCHSKDVSKMGIRFNKTKKINTQRYNCKNCTKRFKIDLN